VSTGKANLYHIPYSGNIEQITVQDIRKLTANDDDATTNTYANQQKRIADARIDDVTVIAPTHGGGLIVRCEDAKREAVYDVVFGGSSVAPEAPREDNVVAFVPTQKPDSVISRVFAAQAQNDNGVSHAPNARGAFETAVHLATPAMVPGLRAQVA